MTHIPYLCWELKVWYTDKEKNTGHANVFDFAASHSFPYMKKRIEVVKKTDSVLHPIEVAIDEMQSKVVDIREVVNLSRPDLKKLQLRLQGSVSAQVITSLSLSLSDCKWYIYLISLVLSKFLLFQVLYFITIFSPIEGKVSNTVVLNIPCTFDFECNKIYASTHFYVSKFIYE